MVGNSRHVGLIDPLNRLISNQATLDQLDEDVEMAIRDAI